MRRVERLEFEAVLEGAPVNGGGCSVRLPADTAERFGSRARFPVRATIHGIAYRGSTMPVGDGTFCLGVTKAIRAAAGVDIGDRVAVVVERDTESRTVDVPDDLAVALDAAGLTERFEGMTFTHRKEYASWVNECFFLDRRVRGQGLRATMLQAAVAYAHEQGAPAVAGYPVEPGGASYGYMDRPYCTRRLAFSR